MDVIRYINHQKITEKKLPPVEIENPAVLRILAQAQNKLYSRPADGKKSGSPQSF